MSNRTIHTVNLIITTQPPPLPPPAADDHWARPCPTVKMCTYEEHAVTGRPEKELKAVVALKWHSSMQRYTFHM